MSQLRLNTLKMYNAETKKVHVYKKPLTLLVKKNKIEIHTYYLINKSQS